MKTLFHRCLPSFPGAGRCRAAPGSEVWWGLAGLALVLFSGCSTPPARSFSSLPGREAEPPVWPAPPEMPRIVYVQSIAKPADAGATVSPWTRFANWMTGSIRGNEPFLKPFGMGLDEKDNLCLTDMGDNSIRFWDRSKNRWRRWDEVDTLRFVSPVAVAKRNGLFYVADSGLGSVVVFDGKGNLRFQITNRLVRPAGLVALDQQLFVADSQRHCVICYDLAGRHLSEFGRRGTEPGEFNFPTHITADRQGRLLVTDSMNGRVQLFSNAGTFLLQLGGFGDGPGYFSRPKGVAVDVFGHIYAVDAMFDNVQIFDGRARFLLHWGNPGVEPGQFWLPNGIVITRHNEIVIADSYNRRLQIFKYIGEP